MTRLILPLLLLLFVVQWIIPGGLIHRHQSTLEHGTAYRFQTAPVDPVDPFRGRYVALDFEAAWVGVPRGRDYVVGQRMYAPIVVNRDGHARLLPPLPEAPSEGDYLRVRVGWQDQNRLRLQLPFDRYYMDEGLAPEAERLYWSGNLPGTRDEEEPQRPAYVVVRVRGGHAVIEELYIDELPVRERVQQALEQAGGR
jgi:uncharacterized membrane-anchored protein